MPLLPPLTKALIGHTPVIEINMAIILRLPRNMIDSYRRQKLDPLCNPIDYGI
jgi:hypothetical protein